VDMETVLSGAPPPASVFAKWRGRGRLPAGRNAAEYLHLTRDGNGR
jgi:hypothetical protein